MTTVWVLQCESGGFAEMTTQVVGVYTTLEVAKELFRGDCEEDLKEHPRACAYLKGLSPWHQDKWSGASWFCEARDKQSYSTSGYYKWTLTPFDLDDATTVTPCS